MSPRRTQRNMIAHRPKTQRYIFAITTLMVIFKKPSHTQNECRLRRSQNTQRTEELSKNVQQTVTYFRLRDTQQLAGLCVCNPALISTVQNKVLLSIKHIRQTCSSRSCNPLHLFVIFIDHCIRFCRLGNNVLNFCGRN
jgi:hypothetical protein